MRLKGYCPWLLILRYFVNNLKCVTCHALWNSILPDSIRLSWKGKPFLLTTLFICTLTFGTVLCCDDQLSFRKTAGWRSAVLSQMCIYVSPYSCAEYVCSPHLGLYAAEMVLFVCACLGASGRVSQTLCHDAC